MELLKGTAPTVTFYHPTSDTDSVSAVYTVDGGIGVSGTVTTETDKTTLRLPYLQAQGSVDVEWTFSIGDDTYTETETYDVVSPYVPISEVKRIIGTTDDETAIQMEAAVRHVINAHTGQSFGYTHKTLTVEGHGEGALRLPERLVVLEGVSTLTANLNPDTAIIVSDGWFIKKGWSEEVTPRESTNLYFGGGDTDPDILPGEPGYEKVGHGYVISAPSGAHPSVWRDDYPFDIVGWWGYKTVPEPVKAAARLLIKDYSQLESSYRDQYLDAIKAADWRLDFNARTWEATGNVKADQLLSEFVLLNWAVV